MIIMKVVRNSFLTVALSMICFVALAQPTANFTASPTSGCAPLVVNFTDLSTGNPTQWRWDLGNGTFSTLRNPSVTYFNPGSYTVKLVVQNASGRDSLIRTQYITINALPTVNFSASSTAGCFPMTVQFTDLSVAGSGTISSWQWDFGDGTLSTDQNPVHTYSTAGNFNVSLRVTNSNGCTRTLTRANFINMMDKPVPNFTNSNATSCRTPATIQFTNLTTGTGTLSYQWSFGDGGSSVAANPTHIYTAAGTYSVQLIVINQNGCRDTLIRNNAISVGNNQTRFTSPDSVCAGVNFSITNTSSPTPVSVTWDFGDGTTSTAMNPTKNYAVAGTYQIKLVNQFTSCSDSLVKNIVVKPRPNAAFTADPLGSCQAPLVVNFSNGSTDAVSYTWNFGDGNTSTQVNPTHTFTNTGSYNIRLTATGLNGCTNTMVRNGYIRIQPPSTTINNLPQAGCAPFPWTFTSTVNTNEPVASYFWDFGDGTTSTEATPTHIFNEGVYDITLIITTASGCRDTAFVAQGISAGNPPNAQFDATPRNTCAYLPVVFSDLSTGTVTQWFWDFGDGGTSILQNPEHAYTDTGYFTVTLIVINNGCPDTLIMEDYVYITPPIANFRTSFDCANPYTRTFEDRSIGADQWLWNFGDGNTSTQQNPVHTYGSPGTYTISLLVRNNQTGCEHLKEQVIQVIDETINFTGAPTVICKKDTVHFSTVGMNPANIATYAWTFGNGQTSTVQNPSIIYNQPGTFTVSLVTTDLLGCADTLVRQQYIRVNGPTASFSSTVPGTCQNSTVSFTDNSTTDGTNPIVRWIWNYGDGVIDTLTGGPFQHTYSTPGVYTVRLTVTDASGCSDSRTRSNMLTISQPQANFNALDTLTCPNRDVTFNNTSTGPGLTYSWDFGDGNSSTVQHPTHTYQQNGAYDIKLTVVDQYGCTDSIIRSSYVIIRTPIANFSVSDSVSTCPPLVVNFTNSSQYYTSMVWDFGDNTSSVTANPSHFYSVSGVFISKLTVTGPGGCTDSKEIPIVVRGPYGTFTYNNITGCTPLQVNFVATTRDRTSFIWDFNDGNTLSTTDSVVSHTYTNPGSYLPRMILRDDGGCVVPVTGTDSIHVYGVNAAIDFNNQPICDAGSVQFSSQSTGNDPITSYQWTFGDGSASTDANPSHGYTQTGLYYPTLVVTSLNNCRDSVRSDIPVRVVASPRAQITQSANGCTPVTISFTGSLAVPDTSAITWSWNFGNGQNAGVQNPSAIVYNTAGNYPVTLQVTNSSGCSHTAQTNVDAYPIPVVSAGPDTLICQGRGITLQATGADTYQWSPANGLSCDNCPNPVATPDSLTTYLVTGTTQFGCSNTANIRVAVKYPFDMAVGRGDTLCVGRATRLQASGAHTYSWTPAAGLDNAQSASPLAAPQTTTNYMVVGTDDRNCFTDTSYIRVVVYPIPTVEAGDDRTVNVGQTIDLVPVISSDVTEVTWTPTGSIFRSDFPAITIRPRETTTYEVVVSNPGKCKASDQVTVYVICNGANIFIPNTFSPNADGMNDKFYPRGTGLFNVKTMRIFNRWGEMVYERSNFNANDANAGWDGRFKGQLLNPDVYVYIIEVKCDNDATLNYKGNITLIR